MESDNQLIDVLTKHYEENVLLTPPLGTGPDLKGRLENPETFAETVAERLNECRRKRENVKPSDLEGSRLAKFDPGLSLTVIAVQKDKIQELFKKMNFPGQVGAAAMGRNDPGGLNVILLPDDKDYGIKSRHEEAHVLRNETCGVV